MKNNNYMKQIYGGAILMVLLGSSALAQDAPAAGTIVDGSLAGKQMVFASAGGIYQEGQFAALRDFIDRTGVNLLGDTSELAKIRAQVGSGNVSWDVVNANYLAPYVYCDTLFERLDFSKIDTSNMPAGQAGPCSVPSMNYATLFLYKNASFTDKQPANWNDFFDVENFPGVRAVYGGGNPAHYMIELALLADGVAKADLFPADIGRGLDKLRAMRDSGDLIFWTTGAESQTMIESGEADMVVAWSGRGMVAVQNGAAFTPVWDGWVVSMDQIAVPKGTKNLDAAHALINAYVGAPSQTILSERTSYSPIHKDAAPQVSPFVAEWLTNSPERQAQAHTTNITYWVEHYGELTEKWADFIGGN